MSTTGQAPIRRLPRAERREQILDAATQAFARTGYSATSLDDIATEAAITRVLLYRHFDSKADLYRAVLDRACLRVLEEVRGEEYDEGSLVALLDAAATDPGGFRLLFRHAAREPEFREFTDNITRLSTELTRRSLARRVPAGPWLDWASAVIPAFTIEAVIAWLDAGQPDLPTAADRINLAIQGVIQAAQT
ncbi:TetR/AcrR family transcriptional regulator [Rhizohabitans arisaemae]|uniref:TetR/AcrR family transcriptional regulator n=1 Tax=Rhizohabitans arisaemae TaxID=2720610 RepID=UPI0024B20B3D|nr:TetR family transcriptional regulator [Rhizohabitans arisaemae]